MGRSERARRPCSLAAAQLSATQLSSAATLLSCAWLTCWLADLVVLDLSEVEQTVDLELVAIEALGVLEVLLSGWNVAKTGTYST